MDFIQGPVQKVNVDWGPIDLSIKRLDLLQSWATGNKYYKLKYNIDFALRNSIDTIVSKGGMFSNHLEALARACHYFNLKCICIIRSHGEDINNPTLITLRKFNAEVVFSNPSEYNLFDKRRAAELYTDALFVPEGGSNREGIKGCEEIIHEIKSLNPTHLIIAGGTMTTAAGIIQNSNTGTHIIIVPAWKGCTEAYMNDILLQHAITPMCTWSLWTEYHFGGFGKYNRDLFNFMFDFTSKTNIPLDPVYTGKMLFAVFDKINSGFLKTTDRILAIHTGGLQGINGYQYRDPDMWKRYVDLVSTMDRSIFQ